MTTRKGMEIYVSNHEKMKL